MLKRRQSLYTYSGKIAFPDVAPGIHDIAISLAREGRYAGAGMCWWPVVLHTFVVCDLLPKRLKLRGLLHDASECITGDLPKPVKTPDIEEMERKIHAAITKHLGFPFETAAEHHEVKVADRRALRGEVYTVGTQALQVLHHRDEEAENLCLKYLKEYPVLECVHADGLAVSEFLRRYRLYRDYFDAR